MKTVRGVLLLLAVISFAIPGAALAASESAIPPGTIITPQNWQKYKQFMSDGLQAIMSGKLMFKLPADYRMTVGPTHHYTLPASYREQTEKYSKLVKIVNLRDGRHTIIGYVAGTPFPNPQDPMKGWKILIDQWFTYQPYIICGDTSHFTLEDRFGNVSQTKFFFVERLFSHRGDPGVSIEDPTAPGIYSTELLEFTSPEQAKYTAILTIYYKDMSKAEDTFIFIPALRRSLRTSTAARCSPVGGSDNTNDDTRHGAFNGNPTRFDSQFLGDRQVLEITQPNPALTPFDRNFIRPLFFPKPEIGKWEVRNTWEIDVRRIPSERAGYCYGKRLLYVDKEIHQSIWADLFDQNMKLWKIDYDPQGIIPVPGVTETRLNAGVGQIWTNEGWGTTYDVQNQHISRVELSAQNGSVRANAYCKDVGGRDFTDATRYSSIRGLSMIMR